jgi:hypothetical protein
MLGARVDRRVPVRDPGVAAAEDRRPRESLARVVITEVSFRALIAILRRFDAKERPRIHGTGESLLADRHDLGVLRQRRRVPGGSQDVRRTLLRLIHRVGVVAIERLHVVPRHVCHGGRVDPEHQRF